MGVLLSKAPPLFSHYTPLLILDRHGIADDEVLNEVIDLGVGLAEDLIPLKGIHSTQEGFSVYGEVIAIGQRDLAAVLGSDTNEAVDVCHGVQSDFVPHNFFLSFYNLLYRLKTLFTSFQPIL